MKTRPRVTRERKNDTLNFRVSSADKATLLEAAARQTAGSITKFVVEPALERARELLQYDEVTTITPEMRHRFVELVVNPPPPSDNLMRRMADRRHHLVDS